MATGYGSPAKQSNDVLKVGTSFLRNFENRNRNVVEDLGNFSILEHSIDASVAPSNAMAYYFMSEMDVKRRQVLIELNGSNTAVLQAGAMQWMLGDINMTTGIKGAGDLIGKAFKGRATGESAIKPEYTGTGLLVLEPTYKFIILQNVADWGPSGMVLEDGMFLACDGSVKHNTVARKNISSALGGNEGLFNMALSGQGVAALESNVPLREIIEINLVDDVIKIDGPMAIAWSGSLDFTVERSGKSLVGSAASGEGLVNVYRGTGKIWLSPVTNSSSLMAATH